ncbi:uncharacterized protein JN550_005459 [Neoarthrinium moseri]|uniref:uncharacterized protein n=1 Tax=Neoarthrinium moseri TaxID=1658444 RepID=UPI001FDE922B|nr:uncharacterized protein JN550_005459 [Neoarthrinium moseri]KAI1869869.1 hypothetical protein JN550_005459 [Neoarthrinium moseri]
MVRLVEYSALSGTSLSRPQYACLSHCWGKTRSKRITTKETLEANSTGITLSELPQTFKDAIEVARALHVRYLWIDSMCIVQDDKIDWEHHVKIMAGIYANAYITLAAGASSDDDGGFFRESPPRFSKPHSFKIADSNCEYEIFLRIRLPHPDEEDWPGGPVMPLMTRGWVFQERLLSRRFLCFAVNEIMWECLDDVACSCSTSQHGFNARFTHELPALLNCAATKYFFAHLSTLHDNKLFSFWRDMVEAYSQRQISFPSDKLPALDGIRQVIGRAITGRGISDTYLFGSWAESLADDLLWSNDWYDRTAGYRQCEAPSWSWISAAEGSVSWSSNTELIDRRWKLKKIPNVDQGVESYGGVMIHGNLAVVSLRKVEDEMEKTHPGFRSCNVYKQLRPADVTNPGSTSLAGPLTTNKPPQLQINIIDDPENPDNLGNIWTDYQFWKDESQLWSVLEESYFMPFGIENQTPQFEETPSSYCWVGGVLLRNLERDLDGCKTFERLGWLRYYIDKPKEEYEPSGSYQDVWIM